MNDGNLFVYGMPGSGKTVFLQTLCLSLSHHFPPQEASIYVLDFGGGSFRRLETLPHIGALMTIEEEFRINQFLVFIFRLIEERKQEFLRVKADGFMQYKEKPGKEMPGIFILIDNYTALSELYDALADRFLTLAREGMKYGIYIVATANQEKAYRFSVNFKMAVAFEMTDKSDYNMVVGRCQGLEPARIPGRALLRHKPPLEFQTANCCFRDQGLDEVLDAFSAFTREGKIRRAMPLPQMPDIVSIDDINSGVSAPMLNVGLTADTLRSIGINTVQNHIFLVTGDPGKGKSTVLASMAGFMLRAGNTKLYLKDSLSAGLYTLAGRENVINLDELEDEYDFAAETGALLDKRRLELNGRRRDGGDIEELKAQWEQIIFVVDNIVEFAESASGALTDLFERIAKKEAGQKVAIWAAGNACDISSSYDSLVRAFKEAQCGIMLGSLREHSVFGVSLPYGSYEKPDFGMTEGYLIARNKYIGIKAAV